MGLDMYLEAERHVGGWSFSPEDEQERYKAVCEALGVDGCPDSPGIDVRVTAVYWRKANAIHNWFVNVVQGGVDDCRRAVASRDDLNNLVELCREVIDTGDTSLLPSTQGFFFGSTQYDKWYFDDLERTVIEVTKALRQFDDQYVFVYQSSW